MKLEISLQELRQIHGSLIFFSGQFSKEIQENKMRVHKNLEKRIQKLMDKHT